ncbi:hypothetical protein niasHT_034618 [Heterodera trifolii]|uniref:Purine nucleoside phosphorylase n=1 Tax=Heterodera trifolii TaxID=157864 RepID=A0ABD2IQE9_9BILA
MASIVDSAKMNNFGIGTVVEPILVNKNASTGGGGRRKKKTLFDIPQAVHAEHPQQQLLSEFADGISPVDAVSMPTATNDCNNNSIEDIQSDRRRGPIDPTNFDHLVRLSELIRSMADLGTLQPEFGIICGSGLGAIADQMEGARILPFSEVPGFPQPSVIGHKGNLVFGRIGGHFCMCLQGRFHPYEHKMDMALCTMPVRLMALLGVRTMIVSNAAGALNGDFQTGDLMVIKDHIFLPGLSGHSPLLGISDPRFGSRFVSLHNAYDKELRKKAMSLGRQMKVPLREGIYVMNSGPQYETAAECSLIARMGGDAVGMSTCHEVTVARQCGMRVFGFSLITNCSSVDSDEPVEVSHDEVLEVAAKGGALASKWMAELIRQISEK